MLDTTRFDSNLHTILESNTKLSILAAYLRYGFAIKTVLLQRDRSLLDSLLVEESYLAITLKAIVQIACLEDAHLFLLAFDNLNVSLDYALVLFIVTAKDRVIAFDVHKVIGLKPVVVCRTLVSDYVFIWFAV